MRPAVLLSLLGAIACTRRAGIASQPPVPRAPLHIDVVYPAATDVVQATDSAFLFGSVGRGDATLTVDGAVVPVQPDGAWIAWVPLPDDSAADVLLVAAAAGDTQRVAAHLRLAAR
ncbi:MAG: hypothetical protein ACM37V_07060, partial [Gemmatimonadota bacterium]